MPELGTGSDCESDLETAKSASQVPAYAAGQDDVEADPDDDAAVAAQIDRKGADVSLASASPKCSDSTTECVGCTQESGPCRCPDMTIPATPVTTPLPVFDRGPTIESDPKSQAAHAFDAAVAVLRHYLPLDRMRYVESSSRKAPAVTDGSATVRLKRVPVSESKEASNDQWMTDGRSPLSLHSIPLEMADVSIGRTDFLTADRLKEYRSNDRLSVARFVLSEDGDIDAEYQFAEGHATAGKAKKARARRRAAVNLLRRSNDVIALFDAIYPLIGQPEKMVSALRRSTANSSVAVTGSSFADGDIMVGQLIPEAKRVRSQRFCYGYAFYQNVLSHC